MDDVQDHLNANLQDLPKEDLIARIKCLMAHNTQLRNIISKSERKRDVKQSAKSQKAFDFSKCTFRHVALKIMYLGWDYRGYVVQEDTHETVEHHLFEALKKTCLIEDRSKSNYHRCGRTDKGVSSFEQVISIDLRSKLTQKEQHDVTHEIEYCAVLNHVLPNDIRCVAWSPVQCNFSARFNCTSRTYKYFFPKGGLNLQKMKEASDYLLGTHDFRNFCKMDVGNGVIEFVRCIHSINITPCVDNEQNKSEFDMCVIAIKGRAFLWHQIRCIMGLLFLIGDGKEEPEIVGELLDVQKNPRKPEYSMVSEIPLNLYGCEYDDDIVWMYDNKVVESVIKILQQKWTLCSVKSTMMKTMLDDLTCKLNDSPPKFVNCLLEDMRSKKYIPLMKRPKCESLENKIIHYAKKGRIELPKSVEQ